MGNTFESGGIESTREQLTEVRRKKCNADPRSDRYKELEARERELSKLLINQDKSRRSMEINSRCKEIEAQRRKSK